MSVLRAGWLGLGLCVAALAVAACGLKGEPERPDPPETAAGAG